MNVLSTPKSSQFKRSKMAQCFCVHQEEDLEMFLDVESGDYTFVTRNSRNG